ncbi:MAG: hypothetical protein EBQ82_07970 [Betaproteobacteria bacterium]|nr:hypothetical protein [Betaproteobacteria bacterium]NBY05308.1 hypothetical protein [Betaproteobacteria bacterium]
MNNRPILFSRYVLAIGVAAMASACGQRGALYLPDQTPPDQRGPYTQPTPASSAAPKALSPTP